MYQPWLHDAGQSLFLALRLLGPRLRNTRANAPGRTLGIADDAGYRDVPTMPAAGLTATEVSH